MRIQEANPDYESCENCIYSDDSVEICILRRCIHAVSSMMERYVPKLSAHTQPEHDENDLDFVQEHKHIPVQLVVSSDCVSRQGAIDTICKTSCDSGFCGVECDEVLALRNMTPTEPEIIGCKECIHRTGKPISDGRFWCTIHGCFMYYCSDEERRLPNESN